MEEEKAAAYYEELIRKGEGAARFKQGLGFSNSSSPKSNSPSSSSSSFLGNFVKASCDTPDLPDKVQTIQNKLNKNKLPNSDPPSRGSDTHSHRSRDRSSDGGTDRKRSRSPRRKRSRSPRRKSRSVDYSHLIPGYDRMTPAQRVKARMKHELRQAAEQDSAKGMGSGWERFEFDKDAPLDDDDIQAAEDDAGVVKHIGQSFRFSAVEARREEQIQAAHDEAMFGASTLPTYSTLDTKLDVNDNKKESRDRDVSSSLLSEKLVAKQQGSWRDRARKL